ncbi:MAG: CCA tRNA nucleotidyltransferase [Pseudomonadota bacterium]
MILAAPWLTAESSRQLMDVLTEGDVPARFVGGCVRDALLGHYDPDVDLDVATPILPEQVIERLEAAGIKAIPTGLSHGTVTAVVDGRPFEITTLRKDVACDGRHAEVAFAADFREDAERRDFTINAMSVDRQGRLVDYFGGVEDLKAGRIRFVGDAQARVREDYLRILRFFRFFARYGRPPVDEGALEACRAGASGLEELSGERIRSEMFKLLDSSGAAEALRLMIENGILSHILPSTPDLEPLQRLITLVPESDPLLRLVTLLSPTSAEPVAEAWKLSNAEKTRLERLTLEPLFDLPHSPLIARTHIYHHGPEIYTDLVRLSAKSASDLGTSLPPPSVEKLPISGQDLIARGVPPGPELGHLLADIEAWWLNQSMQPDRNACLAELDRRLANS